MYDNKLIKSPYFISFNIVSTCTGKPLHFDSKFTWVWDSGVDMCLKCLTHLMFKTWEQVSKIGYK